MRKLSDIPREEYINEYCLMCSYYWMNEGTCWGVNQYDECPQFNKQYCKWCLG